MATHSVTELVQAVRRPRSLSESTNLPFRKSGGGGRGEKVIEALARRNSESLPRRNSENVAPPRRNSLGDAKISMQCINEVPEKKQKKSRRRSFMGFLQGPETDPATVKKIREAIDNQTDVTVQLINYTKSGKKFWNVFHLQPMRDQKGEVQYFIGVQLDGSQHIEPLHNSIPEVTVKESEKLVKETAVNVDEAARELPDANMKPEDLWMNHSKVIHPKPHRRDSPPWRAIQKILDSGEQIGLKHFKPIKPLGSGDTGSVHLVQLCGTDQYYAMKAMDKGIMLNRNKVLDSFLIIKCKSICFSGRKKGKQHIPSSILMKSEMSGQNLLLKHICKLVVGDRLILVTMIL